MNARHAAPGDRALLWRRSRTPLAIAMATYLGVAAGIFWTMNVYADRQIIDANADEGFDVTSDWRSRTLDENRARADASGSTNSTLVYAVFERGAQTAGPRLSTSAPSKAPLKAVTLKVGREAGRPEQVQGYWQEHSQPGVMLFYGQRDWPYRRRAYVVTVAALAAAALIGAGGFALWGLLSERRVRRRLRDVESRLEAFSNGELGIRLPVDGTDDMDRVSRQVNRALERVEQLVGELKRLAGELEQTGERTAHEVGRSVRQIRDRLRQTLAATSEHDGERLFREADDECVIALETIDGILKLSRLGARTSQSGDLIDLFEEIQNRVQFLSLLLEEKDQSVQLQLSPATVKGDRTLIRQMFDNLFENATKYGYPSTDILVSTKVLEDRVRLIVMDHGPGVNPADRARIFEPRRRLDPDSLEEGYGYGLAIVMSIARAHGGHAWVDDATWEDSASGSLFIVEMPMPSAPEGATS